LRVVFSTISAPTNRIAAFIPPTTDTELEIPEPLYKALSKAAVANERTMEEEIIALLIASLEGDDVKPDQRR
jgi:hypothetical protein